MKKLKIIALTVGFGILLSPISVGAQSFGEYEINNMLCNDISFSGGTSDFYYDRSLVICEYIRKCKDKLKKLDFECLKSYFIDILSKQRKYSFLSMEKKLIMNSENYEECFFSLNALLNVYNTAARSRSLCRTKNLGSHMFD
mgnify:FL=1